MNRQKKIDTDLVEKAGINDEKMEINRRIKRFKKEYEEFRSKATALDQSDCYNDFEKVMMAVMKSKNKTETSSKANRVEDKYDEAEKERQQFRLYTFVQLNDLSLSIFKHSKFNERLHGAEDDIQTLYKTCDKLQNEDKMLKSYIDMQIS